MFHKINKFYSKAIRFQIGPHYRHTNHLFMFVSVFHIAMKHCAMQYREVKKWMIIFSAMAGMFLFTTTKSRLLLGPPSLLSKWYQVALLPECYAGHSSASGVEVMNAWSVTSNPTHVFMEWRSGIGTISWVTLKCTATRILFILSNSSSSSLARQPFVGPGLPQNCPPFFPI
jgi:hypothetical protein